MATLLCPLCRQEFDSSTLELITNNYQLECSICYNDIIASDECTLSSLPCKHIFCTNCINIIISTPQINNSEEDTVPNYSSLIIFQIRPYRRNKQQTEPIPQAIATTTDKNTRKYKCERILKVNGVYKCAICEQMYNKNGFSRKEMKIDANKRICQECGHTKNMTLNRLLRLSSEDKQSYYMRRTNAISSMGRI